MFEGLSPDQLKDLFDLKASEHAADGAGTPSSDPTCGPGACLCCYGGSGCCR